MQMSQGRLLQPEKCLKALKKQKWWWWWWWGGGPRNEEPTKKNEHSLTKCWGHTKGTPDPLREPQWSNLEQFK